MSLHYLKPLFEPTRIAVFGASPKPDSVGGQVYRNLIQDGYSGTIYPVNPGYTELDGVPCHGSLEGIQAAIDLAIIATPARTVTDILQAAGSHGVRAALILSSGFETRTEAGRSQERKLLDTANRYGIRLLGPNSLGYMRPGARINASFGSSLIQAGSLALVSQSGALCAAILDWASTQPVGFSTVVSVGDTTDIGFGEILDYLALDPETRSILMYVEGVRDARRFMSGLRAAARIKPVIVIKAGRNPEGARAALSHTGTLIGADDVFDAALKRAGVVRAYTIEQLFAAAQLLATRTRLGGHRLAILTNAGGPGVMATDQVVERGLSLSALTPKTLQALTTTLPYPGGQGNPVDLQEDATPDRFAAALDLLVRDEQVDGVLVLLTPQAMTRPTEVAETVIRISRSTPRPILTCWLGEAQVREGRALFAQHRVPTFINPESAVTALGFLHEYHRNQQMLLQVPGPLAEGSPPDVTGARLIIEGALSEHRFLLSALETRALLHAFRIPVIPALPARSANEALAAAECLGFPVALKIMSPDITHKSEVDGVWLPIDQAEQVRYAYTTLLNRVRLQNPAARLEGVTVEKMYQGRHGRELMLGIVQDPAFGPVISFGAGGTAVEVFQDRAVALPPLNEHLATTLIRQTRAARWLDGWRHVPPIDQKALIQTLLHLSAMACELAEITELDINPLMADEQGVIALDARIGIRPSPASRFRYGHMAIHPYPSHWVTAFETPEGQAVTIRPIRPEDADREQAFVRGLSGEARFFRFMDTLQELSQDMLIRLTQPDYERELALIATVMMDGEEQEIGVARYFTNPDGQGVEFALVIADAWQGQGLGSRLMSGLMDAAREKGFRYIEGEVLARNTRMLRLMQRLGFATAADADDPGLYRVRRTL